MRQPLSLPIAVAVLAIAGAASASDDDVKQHNACVVADQLFLEAEDCASAGLKDRATDLYRKVLDERPDHIGAIRRVAETLNAQGKYGDAVFYVDRALKIRPDWPGLNDLAGLVYRNVGNVDKSRAFFKRACDMGVQASCGDLNAGKGAAGGMKITAKEGSAEYFYQQGKNLQVQGKYDDALMRFEEAIVKEPGHAKSLEEAGYEWSMKGSHDKAIEYYLKALALAPKNGGLWDKIGLSYKAAGNADGAADAFARACKLGSQVSCTDAQASGGGRRGDADTAEILAWIKDGRGDQMKKAEADLRDLARENPNHFLVHNAYAEYWLKKGELEQALAHAKRAVEINPSNAEGHAVMGRIFAAMKKNKEAADALRKACRLGHQSPDCRKK